MPGGGAPNWAWSRVLGALNPVRSYDDDEMVQMAERVAPQLLRAGAEALVGFYNQISRRAGWLTRARSRTSSPEGDRAPGVATLQLVQERRRFLAGPNPDGHYLRPAQPLRVMESS